MRTAMLYRDRLIPRSEAAFMRRQYCAFDTLSPYWLGCRFDDGLPDLGAPGHLLGRPGALGNVERALFKQLGLVPGTPDLRALNPVVIHAHFGRGGALALPIARRLGLPLVVSFHGGDATKDKHYRRQLIPTIYQRRLEALKREARLFVCVSDFIRRRLIDRGFPADKLVVNRYGIEVEGVPALRPPETPPAILFVGRFVEKKGIATLLDAMAILRAQGNPLRLTLVGDGLLGPLVAARAADLGGIEQVGWLANDAVKARMAGALALVVPSVTAKAGDAEGLPNVILEAMASGIPVVGSDSAGIAEAIAHETTGLVVPPGDATALAAALARLAADPTLRRAMATAGRARAEAEFAAPAQSRRLEQILLSVVP
ncbi:MAG TPA: glycosyltransferase [Aliidongia sp.]|uniref:glycosyltransferase n=1 Tax=Aliidongia sp. TaxID=1914230 RepID=UPI002DDD2C6C|nr:glycosyltransferase [Aliidongia sp.]HEV2675997.1 glycosyltransferase [Aliidongia sp.]